MAPARPLTVAFRTFGCKLNQCETAQMQEGLQEAGYRLVDWREPADVRVVNTCTVTAKSDSDCRREIRLAKRADPHSKVVVTGCYAQVDPLAIAQLPGVDLVLGNPDKMRLAQALGKLWSDAGGAVLPAGAGHAARPAATPAATPAADPAAAPATAGEGGPLIRVSPYDGETEFEAESFTHFHGYTRAFLKVQNGCDAHCAYCIIPTARGPARSLPARKVLEQVRLLAERGFREIVLTGINLGAWGRDTGEGSLADLLELLLAASGPASGSGGPGSGDGADGGGSGHRDGTDGGGPGDGDGRGNGDSGEDGWSTTRGARLLRFRLSSVEPLDIDARLTQVIARAGERVAHHFHLPLQSGADSVLARMGRPYRSADYLRVVETLAARFPQAALGADVIVGFPGESDKEFAQTLALVKKAPLTYLHVFSYSDRPGTRASRMRPKVAPETIRARSLALRQLGEHKKAAFRQRLRGTPQRALVLAEQAPDGRWVAITGNYQEVLVAGDDSLVNRFVRVRLETVRADGRWEATLMEKEKWGPESDPTAYSGTADRKWNGAGKSS